MKRIALVIALWAVLIATGSAQKNNTEQQLVKQANELFDHGEFLQAFPLYSQLVSLYPQDPMYNYKFGACAIYGQPDKSQAIKHLTFATRKNVEDPMAWYYLGRAYHLDYRFKDALEAYKAFEQKVDSKIAEKYNTSREIEMCNYGTGLLANMKDVVVINKVESDRENFFRYFNVEDVGGKILTVPLELRTKLDEKSNEPGIMFYPNNSTTIYFSSYGKDGATGKDIYKANVLPDGKFSTPEKLKGGVNTKYDEDFCFMHSNGTTFYFASKGHNSMGGYDIFKCTYDPATDSFGDAINLDFAINTPDDDILYITDKNNERAYFASGRSSDQDHLNVYNVMVKGIPTQVIYLKGEFVSEINPDQKNAHIVVKDAMSERPVQEMNTDGSNGSYVLFIPKAGDYKFYVTTENSPLVHEGAVKIPDYGQPVAFRQEMRLVKEQGVEKLVINNFFDTPLTDDLASLAADMLRKKAGLEVNASEDLMREVEQDPMDDIIVEKTMTNAPLAAGFAEGVSVPQIINEMNRQSQEASAKANEANSKSELAMAYAVKKYAEAESTLKKAEDIRSRTSTYLAEDDVSRLRESHVLSNQAEKLKMEASSSMAAAQLARQEATALTQKSAEIGGSANQLEQEYKLGNFDQALGLLKTEKGRLTALKGESNSLALEELQSKARAKNAQKTEAEVKLNNLRQEEKKLVSDLAASEQRMNNAKKKSEKIASETEYANLKSSLDSKRRQIVNADIEAQQLNDQASALFAQAEFYSRLIQDNSNLGLTAAERKKVSDVEASALSIKLDDMEGRLSALEIHDPQMLAILGEEKQGPAAKSVTEMRGQSETVAARLPKDHPSYPAVKHMIYEHDLAQVNAELASLDGKNSTTMTAQELGRMEELKNYRSELRNNLQSMPAPAVSQDEVRLACNEATPGYSARLQEINNAQGTEIDRTVNAIALKEKTIRELKTLRASNSETALSTSDPSALQASAEKDQQLSASIAELEKDVEGIAPYEMAYESGNKSIIESDQDFGVKLNQQIALGESYQDALTALETKTKMELASNQDPARAVQLQSTLSDIQGRNQEVASKISGYRSDLDLTMSASQPKTFDTTLVANTKVSNQTLEDVLGLDETDENGDHGDEEPAKSKEQRDAEVMQEIFTRRVEEESIIAYETGALDEIIARRQCDTMMVNNRDKLALIQDEIFLVEAEMENESSSSKQKKLDRAAEKLYLKRALLEISNAPAISKMTRAEYTEHLANVEEFNKANKEKIDSRVMIRDEVRSLYNKAKDEMEDATVLRKKAGPVIDDIEKNDFYRRAFAKEAYALRLLNQVEEIHANLDMMLTYSDQELTALRYGKPLPKPIQEAVLASKQETPEVKITEPTPPAVGKPTLPVAENKTTLAPLVTNPGPTSVPASKVQMMAATPMTEGNKTSSEVATQILGSGASNEQVSGLMHSSPFVDYMSNMAVASGVDASRLSLITERNNILTDVRSMENEIADLEKKRDAATTQSEKDNYQAQINTLVGRRDDKYADIAMLDQKIAAMTANIQTMNATTSSLMSELKTTAATTSPVAANAPSKSASAVTNKSASEPSYSTGNTASSSEFFNFPMALNADIFSMTERSVYSESQPIPVDVSMPAGVYYKVQVGAFRNRIPQNLFDDFAPVSGEKLPNGIVRYTAGFFVNYKNAEAVKKVIRNLGYNDAFIVAYRDGKRIPLYEAIDKTDGNEFAKLIESEYVHGDSAPKAASNNTTSSIPVGSGDYYKKYSNAAPAVQVETVSGLFYTVQVGVYSRAVSAGDLHYVAPLCTELTANKKIRYTSGMFSDLNSAVGKRTDARKSGISDAFVTAYFNGRRISLSEADQLIKENGPSIFATQR